ncbi:replication initiator protein A [Fusobacterium necrophorum subsp. funduliforme]|uniref:replication initiator protein A n=1 Tax=Fusobacterium necrophorum TaxID=859 RepID=UPI00078822B4|nr:replication initiator protein A [Fusobacterium necrophorum]KYM54247.1 replication initiator protein A [Fusobacterium necrophorum subsp. funduliforme]
MNIKFNYYYGKEAEQFSFFRIPKLLFTDEAFKDLSSDAKVLYGILLDRMSLSMKNNWIDEENKVYIIFTIEEIANIMCCATQKATKILQELDDKKGIGLVEKKRLGLGKPNILYVKNFIIQETKEQTDVQEEITNQELLQSQNQNDENHNSGNVIFTKQELLKSQCNKTNYNKTEYSNTEYNNTTPISPSKDRAMEMEEIEKILKHQIDYPALIEEQPEEKEKIDLIVNLMTEAIQNQTDIRINQSRTAYKTVREQLLSLQKEHIKYVLSVFRENKQKIINLRAYLLSLLYNAPVNILGITASTKSGTTDYSKDWQIWQDFLNTT